MVWVSSKYRSTFSLYWSFSGLFVLEKEPYAWMVVIEPFALSREHHLT